MVTISSRRQRMIEDTTVRNLSRATQHRIPTQCPSLVRYIILGFSINAGRWTIRNSGGFGTRRVFRPSTNPYRGSPRYCLTSGHPPSSSGRKA